MIHIITCMSCAICMKQFCIYDILTIKLFYLLFYLGPHKMWEKIHAYYRCIIQSVYSPVFLIVFPHRCTLLPGGTISRRRCWVARRIVSCLRPWRTGKTWLRRPSNWSQGAPASSSEYLFLILSHQQGTVMPRYNTVVGKHLLGPPYKRGTLWDFTGRLIRHHYPYTLNTGSTRQNIVHLSRLTVSWKNIHSRLINTTL